MRRILFALIFCSAVAALPAQAAIPQTLVSTHDAWKVYSFLDKGEKVCFMASQPRKQEGKFKKRGEVFFFVTRWPGENERNVVSVSAGYVFKPDSQVTVTVDGKTFKLFTQGEMAWTKDQLMDDAVTAAVQQGASMVVQGTSKLGTATTDIYSLKGSVMAYQAAVKECTGK